MIPSDLRAELPYLLLGTLVLVAGAATAAFSALKVKDRGLLYFGVFAGLYGARLLVLNRIFRAAFEIPPTVSEWCVAVISYTILVPGALFFRVLIGQEWRNSATWVLRTAIVFAPVAIAWAAIAGNPWAPDRVNNVIVITSMLLAAGFMLYRYRRGHGWLILCFLLFLATVVMKICRSISTATILTSSGFVLRICAIGNGLVRVRVRVAPPRRRTWTWIISPLINVTSSMSRRRIRLRSRGSTHGSFPDTWKISRQRE